MTAGKQPHVKVLNLKNTIKNTTQTTTNFAFLQRQLDVSLTFAVFFKQL